jgi:hypothetical protein
MSRRRHDPGKVRIAVRLRRETTLSVKQIAQRLHFGTPKSASFRLLTVMRSQTSTGPAQPRLGIGEQGKIEAFRLSLGQVLAKSWLLTFSPPPERLAICSAIPEINSPSPAQR